MKMPEKVASIIEQLNQNGYEAYAVGGCVRDSVMGRIPEDWDITTSAKPQEIKRIFRRTIDTGIAHGTVTVLLDKDSFEVTTYRIDGEYEDARHPKRVEFTEELREDLFRRDFTMNAMAYNDATGIIDVFGGMEDIAQKQIRCVGEAKERFSEDALRILRAVRFSGQLDFTIEEKTRRAIAEYAVNLSKVSAERIQVELSKLLLSKEPGRLYDAYQLGITAVVLPEFNLMMQTEQNNPHHIYSVGEHALHAVYAVHLEQSKRVDTVTEKDRKKDLLILKWTMLLHDVAKPQSKFTGEDGVDHFYGHQEAGSRQAEAILRRLKFDNETIEKVTRLVRWHDREILPERAAVRRAVNQIGEDIMELLFAVKRADLSAQNPELAKVHQEELEKVIAEYSRIREAEECVSLKTLQITGRDLLMAGFAQGKTMGELLHYLLDQVLENPQQNQKDILLALAEEYSAQKQIKKE